MDGLFDQTVHGGVEVMFLRGFQFGGDDGKVGAPGVGDDFRVTWTAGWWLDKLAELFSADNDPPEIDPPTDPPEVDPPTDALEM